MSRLRICLKNCVRVSACFGVGGTLLCAQPVIITEHHAQKLPLAKDLGQKSVIRNASGVAVDAVCSLLNQTAVALADAEQVYSQRAEELIEVIEYSCKVLGIPHEETLAWDRLLDARSKLDEAKRERQEMLLLMVSVEQAVNSAAVVAFQTDAEYAGITAGERLVSIHSYLKSFQEKSAAAEHKLSQWEVKSIEITSRYYKEKITKGDSNTVNTGDQHTDEGLINHGEAHERLGEYDEEDAR